MPKAVEYIFTLYKDIKYFEFASYFYKKKYFFSINNAILPLNWVCFLCKPLKTYNL